MIEFCKYLRGLLTPIMKEVFVKKRVFNYNFQSCRVTILTQSGIVMTVTAKSDDIFIIV